MRARCCVWCIVVPVLAGRDNVSRAAYCDRVGALSVAALSRFDLHRDFSTPPPLAVDAVLTNRLLFSSVCIAGVNVDTDNDSPRAGGVYCNCGTGQPPVVGCPLAWAGDFPRPVVRTSGTNSHCFMDWPMGNSLEWQTL